MGVEKCGRGIDVQSDATWVAVSSWCDEPDPKDILTGDGRRSGSEWQSRLDGA